MDFTFTQSCYFVRDWNDFLCCFLSCAFYEHTSTQELILSNVLSMEIWMRIHQWHRHGWCKRSVRRDTAHHSFIQDKREWIPILLTTAFLSWDWYHCCQGQRKSVNASTLQFNILTLIFVAIRWALVVHDLVQKHLRSVGIGKAVGKVAYPSVDPSNGA